MVVLPRFGSWTAQPPICRAQTSTGRRTSTAGLGSPRASKTGWMILDRGPITLEFFPVAVDPRATTGSACLRVDDLDALPAIFGVVGQLPRFCRTTPGVLPIQGAHGLPMFVLIDPDGNLLRCLDNLYGAG